MEETETTAAAILSFVEKLEDDSSKFYGELAERYEEGKETFLYFAKESKKNKVLIVRTYQETITDALEACFCFRGLGLNNYLYETRLTESTSYSDALKAAIGLEKKAHEFYSDVAERTKTLLATIPIAFTRVAKNRKNREPKLKALIDSLDKSRE